MMLAMATLAVGSLGFVKYRQIDAAIKGSAAFQPPPEAVTTIVARQEQWPAALNAIGSVAAAQGVTLAADLPGLVDKIIQVTCLSNSMHGRNKHNWRLRRRSEIWLA